MYKKGVYLCVRDRYKDALRQSEREHPVLLLSVHANEKAVLREWKALRTADLLKQKGAVTQQRVQYILYRCIPLEPVRRPKCMLSHCSLLIRLKYGSRCQMFLKRKKVALCCKKVFTSAHTETYIVVNQEKWTRDGDLEGKTNGAVHRWESKGKKQALCDSQYSWAIPSSKLPAIYHFITSPDEHAVYFLYQHI